MSNTTHQDLLNRIARGEIQQVIETLLSRKDLPEDRQKELIAISARHRRLKSGRRMGLLSFQEDNITESQITASLVDLIELPPSTAFSEEKSINHRVPLRTIWWKYIVAASVVVGLLAGIATIVGLFWKPVEASNSVTVLVHGHKGKDDLVLPNRGIVTLIYGDAIVSEQINNQGEAVFQEISGKFFAADARVEVLFSDPKEERYRAVHHDSLYRLIKGQHLPLEVRLDGLDTLHGIVRDFVSHDPIDSARISVQGLETYSNAFGEYAFSIPPDKQQPFVTVRANKRGYEFWELKDVPVQTGADLEIFLHPKR